MESVEPKKFGIENAKKAVDLGFSAGEAVKKSLADGKFGAEDFANVLPLVPQIIEVADHGSEIVSEFKDLDADEGAQLIAYSAAKLGGIVDSEKLVIKINASFKVVASLVELYKAFK